MSCCIRHEVFLQSRVAAKISEFQNRSLGLIGIQEAELNLSDADDVEREAIGAECFDRFFIREELEFLTSHEDLEHAIAGNDVGHFLPRRTASLDQPIQKAGAPEANEVAL